MEVILQGEKENTCVACAAVNALRHFGMDPIPESIIEALRIPRFGANGGSFVHKAAKHLAAHYGMHVAASRPRCLITDYWAAAEEAATRWAALLNQGYVGLLHRRERKNSGHAVVLYRVRQSEDGWLLDCYDSNKRHADGWWTYRAIDYVWWAGEGISMTEWLAQPPEEREMQTPKPTGRHAWFVRPWTAASATTGADASREG